MRQVREIRDLRGEQRLGEQIMEQEQLLSKLLSEQHQVRIRPPGFARHGDVPPSRASLTVM